MDNEFDILSATATDKRPLRVSVSRLKAWSRCAKKYYLDYVQELHWPQDQRHFALGQDVHKLLEFQARGLDCAPLADAATRDVADCWTRLVTSDIVNLPVLGSEWAFTLPLAGCWVEGRVDRVARRDDQILVIDWKTGTAIPKNPADDWQTRVYLYAVYTARKQLALPDDLPHEALTFVYVEVGPNGLREVAVPYSEEDYLAFEAHLVKVLEAMKTAQEFPLPEACPDKYCPYRQICGILEK